MDCGIYGWGSASLPMENMSRFGHPAYGNAISTNPTSDARSFPPQDPLAVDESWVNCRPEPPDVPAYTHNFQFNTEVPSSPHPSIPATHIHEGAVKLYLEDVIADIHDESSSVVHSPEATFWTGFSSSFTQMSQNSTEVFGLPLVFSNDSLTYVDHGDVDTTYVEGESINIPSDQGNQYSQSDTTSETSDSSVPSGISRAPAIVQHQQQQRKSRDQHYQLQKSGKRKERVASSLRSCRRPTPARGRGARNGPYLCNACGKSYAQRQGVERHRRETHDARSCNHCGTFRWGRPYVFKKHIQQRHPDLDPDVALQEAIGAGRRDPSVTPPTPERDRDRRTHQPDLTPPHQVAPISPIMMSGPPVNHDPQPESAKLTIKRNGNVTVTKQDDFRCLILVLPVRIQESVSN